MMFYLGEAYGQLLLIPCKKTSLTLILILIKMKMAHGIDPWY